MRMRGEYSAYGRFANSGYLRKVNNNPAKAWTCVEFQEDKRHLGLWQQQNLKSMLFQLFFILLFASSICISAARPHRKRSTPPLSNESLALVTGDNTFRNDTRTSGKEEWTRILTFPQRPTSNSHRHSNHDEDDDEDDDTEPQDIVFPDSLENFETPSRGGSGSSGIAFEPVARLDTTPDCADGSGTFCEEIPTYPYKLLRDVLGRSKNANNVLFGMDETPDEIVQRIGEPEENYICGALDKTVYPKVGKTKNNKWKYIINQGSRDGYVQGVRVETCISMGKPCDLFGSQPNGYITSCKQKYIYRKMLSLSEGGQPIPDTFLMPSACCCSYKRDTRFLARFGEAPVTPVR